MKEISLDTPWKIILWKMGIHHFRERYPSGNLYIKCISGHRELTPSLCLREASGRGKCYGCGWTCDKREFVEFLEGFAYGKLSTFTPYDPRQLFFPFFYTDLGRNNHLR